MRTNNDNNDFENAPYRPDDAFFASDYEDAIEDEMGSPSFDSGDSMTREQLDEVRERMLAFVNKSLAKLSVFEQEIIKARFGFSHGYAQTNKEIGTFFNCTETNIRVLMRGAFAKLRSPGFFSEVYKIASGLAEDVTKNITVAENLKNEITEMAVNATV